MCRPVPACCQSATHQTHARTAIAPQRIAPRRSPLSAAALPRRHGMGWDGQRPRVSASRGDRDDALPAAVQQWASVYLGYLLPTYWCSSQFQFPTCACSPESGSVLWSTTLHGTKNTAGEEQQHMARVCIDTMYLTPHHVSARCSALLCSALI